jgi:teichuronic acid biosynthesis glycosyltransferase TuaG
MTYCQYRRFTFDPNRPGPVIRPPSVLTYGSLFGNTAIAGCSTVMIDTALSGPIEFPNFPHEDLCLWLHLLRDGQIARGLCEDLARYRVSPNSSSANKFRNAIEVWYVFRTVEALSVTRSSFYLFLYAARSVLRRIELRRR